MPKCSEICGPTCAVSPSMAWRPVMIKSYSKLRIAAAMVWEVAQAVDIPINGVGGVMNDEDAAEFILAGATCVSVGMANFVDPCASLKIAHELEAWAESQGVKDINELVGAFEC